MKKLVLLSVLLLLLCLTSCNSELLMNNGEIVNTNNSQNTGFGNVNNSISFSYAAPENVTASTSYFQNKIVVRWKGVEGADYYSIEKASHLTEEPDETTIWNRIPRAVNKTTFEDTDSLEPSVYYSYRITAHTLDGFEGDVSEYATGTILASPVSFDASKGSDTNYIYLSWEQMPNVYSYNIYKSTYDNTTGQDNEFLKEVSTNSNQLVNMTTYRVSEEEKGKELYFVIRSVGETGEIASSSNPRLGYTRVLGAPMKPAVSSITKGTDSKAITIEFEAGAGDDLGIVITRSLNGGSEVTVYSTDNANGNIAAIEALGEGKYLVRDASVSANTNYTYSIYTYNSIGKSEAVTANGYLLSSVRDIQLAPVRDGEKLGYQIKGNWQIGYDDEERISSGTQFRYRLHLLYKNMDEEEKVLSENEFFGSEVLFFPVKENPTPEDEKKEIQRVDIAVQAYDKYSGELVASSAMVSSNVISKLSTPVSNLMIISNAEPLEGDTPNSYGIYPLNIRWSSDSDRDGGVNDGVFTLIKTGSDGSQERIVLNPSNYQKDGNSYLYKDTGITNPLVVYSYMFDTTDELGRTLGQIQKKDNCYPTITLSTLADLFGSLSLKPWDLPKYVPNEYKAYWKNSRIATLIGYGNSSSLSTQTKALEAASDKDHFRGGTIYYNAKLEGVNGSIIFEYKDFGESEYFYSTGNYSMLVSASGDGSCTTNTNGFTLYGNFPGRIGLEEIVIKSKGFSGNYNVSLTRNKADGSGTVTVTEKVQSK